MHGLVVNVEDLKTRAVDLIGRELESKLDGNMGGKLHLKKVVYKVCIKGVVKIGR